MIALQLDFQLTELKLVRWDIEMVKLKAKNENN